MSNRITQATVNIFNVLKGTIEFQPGLNILSGENGTLKTKLLQALKTGSSVEFEDQDTPPKIQAISPKRNAERRNFQTIIKTFRQQSKTFTQTMEERINAQINDQTFDNYPSFGDLFFLVYEDLCKDGGNQLEKMNQVTEQFNGVIEKIFENYALKSEWDRNTGAPSIILHKMGANDVALEALSLGEQEILSLVINLYSSRKQTDIYLIDEPEIHLNWHLEDKLFRYFEDFCNKYEKQLIVVTHSRVVFSQRYLPKTQFLVWNDGKVICTHEITETQRRRIAGDAIEIIKLDQFHRPTFFVEDARHVDVIEAISNSLDTPVLISECRNSSNVRALFRLAKKEGWTNCYFVTDGDGEGNPFKGENQYIHLDQYCIDNFLLDIDLASEVLRRSKEEIKDKLLNSIKINREKILKKNKFLEFLFDGIEVSHITPERLGSLDGSVIIEPFLAEFDITFQDYLERYVSKANQNGQLETIFPVQLIEAMR